MTDNSENFLAHGNFFDEVWFRRPRGDGGGHGADFTPTVVWPELDPCTRTLPKGYQVAPEYRPTVCDMTMHQDVAIPMRDGVLLYADIFLPAAPAGPVPVVLA